MAQDVGVGKIITDEGAARDAIHVAVVPMTAAVTMGPGVRVGVDGDGDASPYVLPHVGIVDPFLEVVKPGQRFWVFMFPNTVTMLRHAWTHPAFESEATTSPSEAWLRVFAEEMGLSYNKLLSGADEWVQYGEYCHLSYDLPEVAYDKSGEFWVHYEVVTGRKIDPGKKNELL